MKHNVASIKKWMITNLLLAQPMMQRITQLATGPGWLALASMKMVFGSTDVGLH